MNTFSQNRPLKICNTGIFVAVHNQASLPELFVFNKVQSFTECHFKHTSSAILLILNKL